MKNVSDFELPFDLSGEMGERELVEIHIGDVNLPTGRIVASDPFFSAEQAAFARSVEPDKYPVYIYVSEIDKLHHRIAYAKIKFRPEDATKWILALTEDITTEELGELEEGEFYGFAVESGLACFMDEETSEEFNEKLDVLQEANPEYNYYDSVLSEEFREYSGKNTFSRELGDWNDHKPNPESDNNIVMFASGWGDGYFPAYFGLNENGDTIELVVDFLLDEFEADEDDDEEGEEE
ncbi:DUF4241 domain-containing protein [Flavobacterium psychrotrophum]|uniref:DUF4241 domain-containing protein n=1 Tax=Flavobacterium psychrotrophum TaxID=2294119 RepID=UPI000E31C330|nr:DUF4241 domain-containing protein [Flavobacterium psychrotrophum]